MDPPVTLGANLEPTSARTRVSQETAASNDQPTDASNSHPNPSTGIIEPSSATNGVSTPYPASRTKPTPKPKINRDPPGTPARPDRAATSPRVGATSSSRGSRSRRRAGDERKAGKDGNSSSPYGPPPASPPVPSGPERPDPPVPHLQPNNAPAFQPVSEGTPAPPNGGSDVPSQVPETGQAAMSDSPLASPNVEVVALLNDRSDTPSNVAQAATNDSSFAPPRIEPTSNSETTPAPAPAPAGTEHPDLRVPYPQGEDPSTFDFTPENTLPLPLHSGSSEERGNVPEANETTATDSQPVLPSIETPNSPTSSETAISPPHETIPEADEDDLPLAPQLEVSQLLMPVNQTSGSSTFTPSVSSTSQQNSTSMASADPDTSPSGSHPAIKSSLELEDKPQAEAENPCQAARDVSNSLKLPSGSAPNGVAAHLSTPADVVPMQRIQAISPDSRNEIQEAIVRRHKKHTRFATRVTIHIRRLATVAYPQEQKSLTVSKKHTLLELYTLILFEFNTHPEQSCLYWRGEALDLLTGSAKPLRDFGIKSGSALVLSHTCPGAFVKILTPQAAERLAVEPGSELIAHKVISQTQIRCSDSQERTGVIGFKRKVDGVQFTKVFQHSLAAEVASVSGSPRLDVGPAPVRSESIYPKNQRPHGGLANLMSCFGVLRSKPVAIDTPLYLPPWSTGTAQVTNAPISRNPHLLLKEDFGRSTVVAFEVRSNPLESSSSCPSISIAVKCITHGSERVSSITLTASLPEQECITGISPKELLGPVDAAAISSYQAQSGSAGIDVGIGLDVARGGVQLRQTKHLESSQVFAGKAQQRTGGVVLGNDEASWTMKENQNGLEGLPTETHLTLKFDSKPRTVLLTYRINVARGDGKKKKSKERQSTAVLLFP
ncbi:hypothetical protein BKA70DRAFT_1415169 [Coprinopsis sp. MPI-PUGE-AT-0042]|nr:hypothetical protein BKA70DRAFT_1415169 [Coprinopsis sp. MPI-PUGE-AT-0042]